MTGAVRDHYARPGLVAAIDAALAAAGHDPARPGADALEALDEFHLRGAAATRGLAAAAGLAPGMLVLDLGCGLGGPARRLAAEVGCGVIGLDLNPDYVAAARILAERAGLAGRIAHGVADATRLPLPDRLVDAVWMQHVGMNVADKAALYGEAARVLRPRGVLALYDVLAGPGGSPHLPAPWAREAGISHLAGAEALARALAEAGLSVERTVDRRADALTWMTEAGQRRRAEGPPAIGLDLLFGDAFPEMGRNLKRNLEEARIVPTEIVARKL